jgi:hypothetical protein
MVFSLKMADSEIPVPKTRSFLPSCFSSLFCALVGFMHFPAFYFVRNSCPMFQLTALASGPNLLHCLHKPLNDSIPSSCLPALLLPLDFEFLKSFTDRVIV